jgi:peptide/nickel transport system substrate-binding protein
VKRFVTVGFAIVLLAAACAQAPTGTAASPQAQVDPNAEVKIAADEDQWPAQGDAAKSTYFAYPLNVNVFEPLIKIASDYSLQPALAEKWELVPPNTWRFTIRQGVKFHDGHVMTVDDVMWSWGGPRQMEAKLLSTVANTLGPNSVKKIDEKTIDITPAVPNLRLPEQIGHLNGLILPNGKYTDSPGVVGTGPFKVVDYAKSDHVTLERFDDYWGDKPKVKRMTVRFLPDTQARIQALRAGEVDFIKDAPPDAVRSLDKDGYVVVKSKPGRNQLIYLNRNSKAPHDLLGEKAVREAIQFAIERKAYVDTVFDGVADPGRAMAPISILSKYSDQVPAPKTDVDRAKKALEDAGWKAASGGIREKAGRKLSLELIAWAEVSSTALELLQAQLRAVGIDVVIKKAADTPTYSNFYRNGQYDMDLEVPNQNDANPAFLPVLRMYSKNATAAPFAPGAAFDALAEKSNAATNVDGAQQAAAQMMNMLINDEHTVIPLAGLYRIYAMRKGVNLGDPHPSTTNQTWLSLTVTK